MESGLGAMELCEDLEEEEVARLQEISRHCSLLPQEYLFLLGERAEVLYAVTRGRMDLCFPISIGGSIRDIVVQSILPGHSLGWSCLVKPYRFTLSARAAEATDLVCFPREELLAVFARLPRIGYQFMRRLAEVVGSRHLNLQALWARELQRSVTGSLVQELSQGLPDATA